MLQRFRESADRERIKKDIVHGIPGWYNHFTAVGGDWSRMLISDNNPFQGKTMDVVLAALSKGKTPDPDPLDLFLDFLLEHNGSVATVFAHHSEADMNLALAQPWCSVGSDGSALAIEGALRRGNPHPRNFGTFPRILGVYVREKQLLRLEDAVRKMTSLNASKIGIPDRGWIRAGNFADIVLFDPIHVRDRSTYTDPFQYCEGIEYVIVNGQVVLDRGTHTGKRPGRALRHDASNGT
jgi:N-acyl-D-aspartate/D-glutamate deacylase